MVFIMKITSHKNFKKSALAYTMYTPRKDSHIITKECTTNLPGQVMIFSAKKKKKSTIGTQSTRVITVTVKSLIKKSRIPF